MHICNIHVHTHTHTHTHTLSLQLSVPVVAMRGEDTATHQESVSVTPAGLATTANSACLHLDAVSCYYTVYTQLETFVDEQHFASFGKKATFCEKNVFYKNSHKKLLLWMVETQCNLGSFHQRKFPVVQY